MVPLGVFGQHQAESPVVVGSVVDDVLRVRNADVHRVHDPGGEVAPVKHLSSTHKEQEEETLTLG